MGNALYFQPGNDLRREAAAQRTVAAVREILNRYAGQVPATLASAGQLRIRYPDASLAELGRSADPPITKDAVASRLRRLIALDRNPGRRPGRPRQGASS